MENYRIIKQAWQSVHSEIKIWEDKWKESRIRFRGRRGPIGSKPCSWRWRRRR